MLLKGFIVISIASFTFASILKTSEELPTSNKIVSNVGEVIERQTGLKVDMEELENKEDASKAGERITDDALSKVLNIFKNKAVILGEDDEEMANNNVHKFTSYGASFGRDNTESDNESTDNIRVKRQDDTVLFDNCEGSLVMKYKNGRLECTDDDDTDTVDLENRIFGGTLCKENQKRVVLGKRIKCLDVKYGINKLG